MFRTGKSPEAIAILHSELTSRLDDCPPFPALSFLQVIPKHQALFTVAFHLGSPDGCHTENETIWVNSASRVRGRGGQKPTQQLLP